MFYAIVKFNFLAEELTNHKTETMKKSVNHIAQTFGFSSQWVDANILDEALCSACFSLFSTTANELNKKIDLVADAIEQSCSGYIESENIYMDSLANLEDENTPDVYDNIDQVLEELEGELPKAETKNESEKQKWVNQDLDSDENKLVTPTLH